MESNVEASNNAKTDDDNTTSEDMVSKRRKELFGDCALIEIIHLHDCLRGALRALENDVNELTQLMGSACKDSPGEQTNEAASSPTRSYERLLGLEGRVAGRFKVIWSVFRAHSSAEDEFIWPALRLKTQGQITSSPSSSPSYNPASKYEEGGTSVPSTALSSSLASKKKESAPNDTVVRQEDYEEDHEHEEVMFSEMDRLLSELRESILRCTSPKTKLKQELADNESDSSSSKGEKPQRQTSETATSLAHRVRDRVRFLSGHLMTHLDKEESKCLPLVAKHLSKSEIFTLVGNIMGRRSADTITQIMTMAVQSLDEDERQEMVGYMKQSMKNTFFDRWLLASGWGKSPKQKPRPVVSLEVTAKESSNRKREPSSMTLEDMSATKRRRDEEVFSPTFGQTTNQASIQSLPSDTSSYGCQGVQITSQAELEKLIRTIVNNPGLTPQQKNTTIQGLRDSVWKSNQKAKRQQEQGSPPTVSVNQLPSLPPPLPSESVGNTARSATLRLSAVSSAPRVALPPSSYFKKVDDRIQLVWKNEASASSAPQHSQVPLFSAAELAPTFHDGAAGAVLGCPHYARSCKLRHPKSGRLYTCRLCCDQQRELPNSAPVVPSHMIDEKLDRYAVREVMCMKCNALQPAEDRCVNPECESRGKPFARYFCRICHLYDDGTRPIFHCPYCNTCRLGQGLGIDYRHCMRCNACVSLSDTEHHCLPQKLQGTCPICHESLFQSTEPLRGLKCGHVLHLKCYTQYRRTSYTCPLCMRSMEDMKDHFALLDAAIRMQPMPASFLNTLSNIYCQDCGKTGQVQYHFVGQKCPHCQSYNTREMGRTII